MLRDGQLRAIVRALLSRANASLAWDATQGRFVDSPEANERLRTLSSGESALVSLARCVWNPRIGCDLGPIIRHMDAEGLRYVGQLIAALRDPQAADAWLARWGGGAA